MAMFYRALLLTAVNLALRLVGTGFQVYLSRRIGPEGIGLLQLTLSVGSMATIMGIGGIRTATMYLTAEALGRRHPGRIPWILSGCLRYSLVCSLTVGTGLYLLSPILARQWIGSPAIAPALTLFACFLPTTCLCAVMSGYFTGENRIGTLAGVEILEQFFSMAVTVAVLALWVGHSAVRACRAVIFGSAMGSCLSLLLLWRLYRRTRPAAGAPLAVAGRITRAAVPLAIADTAKSGISTLENLMVPKRLAYFSSTPLAEFGIITGMVFPVLMFPACILFGLSELLIPEMARAGAAGADRRIRYLLHKALRAALLYSTFFCGILYLSAPELCDRLYQNEQAGLYLRLYAPLIPMLYCDAIVDAMTKGLGQQTMAVKLNILTNSLDVALLFFLLPKWGMKGYFISFLITHVLNFTLSIRHLLRTAGEHLSLRPIAASLGCCAGAVWVCRRFGAGTAAYCLLFLCLMYLTGSIRRQDLLWLKGLVTQK